MDINKKLAETYGLTKDHFWQSHGKWIISHDACELIAEQEGIVFHDPQVLVQDHQHVAFIGSATLPVPSLEDKPVRESDFTRKEKTVWTTGEAAPDNCFNKHVFAMAEKRLKDRLILKLIAVYHLGVYSDAEADDFAKGHKTEEDQFVERQENKRSASATDKQKDFLSELLSSSHLTDEYKSNCLDFVNNGISVKQASNLIDETQTRILKAKNEERTQKEA